MIHDWLPYVLVWKKGKESLLDAVTENGAECLS